MKRIVFSIVATLALCACEVIVEPVDNHRHDHGYYDDYGCYDEEPPYDHYPVESWYYYGAYGEEEGECSTWLVASYYDADEYEQWCNWEATCGWEFIGTYIVDASEVYYSDYSDY